MQSCVDSVGLANDTAIISRIVPKLALKLFGNGITYPSREVKFAGRSAIKLCGLVLFGGDVEVNFGSL